MKKMYVEQIHTGLNTLALSMDAQWFGLNRKDATEAQRNACDGLYQGYITALCMMGGDWKLEAISQENSVTYWQFGNRYAYSATFQSQTKRCAKFRLTQTLVNRGF